MIQAVMTFFTLLWADLVTASSYAVGHPVILVGGLALVASAITTAIVTEVRNR